MMETHHQTRGAVQDTTTTKPTTAKDGFRLCSSSPANNNNTNNNNNNNDSSEHGGLDADVQNTAAVATLPNISPQPYSAVSLSPNGQHAVTACNGSLQMVSIGPDGMKILKTIPFDQHASVSGGSSGSNAVSPSPTSVTVGGGGGGGGGGLHHRRSSQFHRPLRISEDLFEEPGQTSSRSQTQQLKQQLNSNLNINSNHSNSCGPKKVMMMNVVVNDVAWSGHLMEMGISSSPHSSKKPNRSTTTTTMTSHQYQSLIAAAGSNGSIVVWRQETLLQGQVGQQKQLQPPQLQSMAPEVVLNQHIRAVNRLAWHPKRQILLSASHDSTVRLWERKRVKTTTDDGPKKKVEQQPSSGFSFPFFGDFQRKHNNNNNTTSTTTTEQQSTPTYTWQCTGVFEPRCESVRDVGWNPMSEDIFALCTSNGCLIVYNRWVRARAMLKVNAHDRDATTLEWHPTRPNTIATGGSNDRLVKIWDLEQSLLACLVEETTAIHIQQQQQQQQQNSNQNTMSSTQTDISDVSSTDDSSTPSFGSRASTAALTYGSTSSICRQPPEHVLAVAAPVKRVRWRPPASKAHLLQVQPSTMMTAVAATTGGQRSPAQSPSRINKATMHHLPNNNMNNSNNDDGGGDHHDDNDHDDKGTSDRHESMLAVATVPIKGESGGGSGFVALWSYDFPYMPLSILEGHKEGAVTDMAFLDAAQVAATQKGVSETGKGARPPSKSKPPTPKPGGGGGGGGVDPNKQEEEECIWQHILSVGKDGQCLIQSLARGDRPITHVPPSCFAMANLSPFQRGYGSLQIFSICQEVNRGSDSWLRMDHVTASAPGIFRVDNLTSQRRIQRGNHNLVPRKKKGPIMTFHSLDQGNLDHAGKPATVGTNSDSAVIAPEVVHLSRFAEQYEFYPTVALPTRIDICLHNMQVAESLQNQTVAQIWQTVSGELERAAIDSLAVDVMEPIHDIKPVILGLLEGRANDGDVQSCVALCEVLEIVNSDRSTQIPGLEIQLVREWYLSYIDLLRHMRLFSHACDVIRNCNDAFVSGQNKHSTALSESCQRCGKPILTDRFSIGRAQDDEVAAFRRMCRTCQKVVGHCFICHEPVTGMYVWCPGCGHGKRDRKCGGLGTICLFVFDHGAKHFLMVLLYKRIRKSNICFWTGGHLEHAMSWFSVRQECPTGCGHICNMLQTLSAFPRSTSMREIDKLDISLNS